MATHIGIRAVGIGTMLVVGSALLVGWASRHQRRWPSPLTAESSSRQVEGGI
jgi:hypothetical protein